jgi:hypothetical protein
VLIVGADAAALITTEHANTTDAEFWSDTLIPKFEVPAADGVPEIWPDPPFNARPAGSWPVEIVQV